MCKAMEAEVQRLKMELDEKIVLLEKLQYNQMATESLAEWNEPGEDVYDKDRPPMAETLTTREIIIAYLAANGYDGLCGDDCGCEINDLGPCDFCDWDCVPGYKIPTPENSEYYGECDTVMVRERPEGGEG